jgi:hypothetical protein
MKRLSLAILVSIATGTSAVAIDKRFEASLRKLDPTTRFEQLCDAEAMHRIGRSKSNPFRPDRALTAAVTEAVIKGDTMKGEGGAFRHRKKWYQFSFTCTASPDRMKIKAFDFRLGEEIPEKKWEDYGLWR